MSLFDAIQEQQVRDEVDLKSALGRAQKANVMQDGLYSNLGELNTMVDAFTSDGSDADNQQNTYNQERIGYDIASGQPKAHEMLAAVVPGALAYKAGELAVKGVLYGSRAIAQKSIEQSVLRLGKTARTARDTAANRTANLYKNSANISSATKKARSNKYIKQKEQYWKDKASQGLSTGPGMFDDVAIIAGDVAGNVAAAVPFAHEAKYQKDTGDYRQETDAELIAKTVVSLGGMALPFSAISHGNRARKIYKTKEAVRDNLKDTSLDAAINIDKAAIDQINKTTKNSGKTNKDGFIEVNDLGKTEGHHGAFVDKNTGEIRISTEYMGETYGEIKDVRGVDSGVYILNKDKSSVRENVFMDEYKDTRAGVFIDKLPETQSSTAKPYTSGKSIKPDNEGNVAANTDLKNVYKGSEHWEKHLTDEENYAKLDAEMNKIKEGKNTYINDTLRREIEDAIGTSVPKNFNKTSYQSIKSNPTIDSARIKSGTVGSSNPLVNDLAAGIRDLPKDTTRPSIEINKKVKGEKRSYTRDQLDQNPHLEDVFEFTTDGDKTGNYTSTIEGVKQSILDDLELAVDLALAKHERTEGYISTRDIDGAGVSASAMGIFENLNGLEPMEGKSPHAISNIKQELVKIADTMIERTKVEKTKNQQGTYVYEVRGGSRAQELRSILEARVGQKYNTVNDVFTETFRDVVSSRQEAPTTSGKAPKIKDDFSKPNGIVESGAKSQAGVKFSYVDTETVSTFRTLIEEFENGTSDSILSILNENKPIVSTTVDQTLRGKVKILKDVLNDIESLGKRDKGNGEIRFPVEVGENLRTLYTGGNTPMSDKLMRAVIQPVVGFVDYKNNKMFVERSILSMLDASMTIGVTKHKVNMLTNNQVSTLFQKVLKDGIDGIKIDDMVGTRMLASAIEMEGFHSIPAIKAMQAIKRGENGVHILVEGDGKNNGYAFQEIMSGNFYESAVGTGVENTGLITPIGTRELMTHKIKSIVGNLQDGPSKAMAETMSPSDTKFMIMSKIYSGGLKATAAVFGDHTYGVYMDNLRMPNHPVVAAVDNLLQTIGGKSIEKSLDLDAKLVQSKVLTGDLEVLRAELYEKSGDKTSLLNDIKVKEISLKQISNDIKKMTEELNVDSNFYGIPVAEVVKIHQKLLLDRNTPLHTLENIGDRVLDTNQIALLKDILSKDSERLIDQTVDTMYAKPEDIGLVKGDKEYAAQYNRYQLKNTQSKVNKTLIEDYSIIANDKSVIPKDAINQTAKDIAKAITKNNDKLNFEVVRADILGQMNKKGKSLSIVDALNAVIEAEYSTKALDKNWALLDHYTPYIETYHGEKVRLVTFESRMGMKTAEDGTPMNYKSIMFRLNNDPMPVLGTDAGVMGLGLKDNPNLMSILDAVWGGSNVEKGLKQLNDAMADVGKNSNIYDAMAKSVERSRKMRESVKEDQLVKEDAAHFLARSKNRSMKQDHMTLKDESLREINSNDSRVPLEKQLDNNKNRLNATQKALSDDWGVSNYSIGLDTSIGKAIFKDERFNAKADVKSRVNTRDYSAYENVRTVDGLQAEVISFGKKDNQIGRPSSNIELQITKDLFEYDSNIIRLGSSDFTANSFFALNHEVGHKTYETLSNSARDALNQFILDYVKNGKLKVRKKDIITGDKADALVSEKGNVNIDETMSNLAEVLFGNEGSLSNATFLSTRWGKGAKEYNIAAELKDRYIELSDNVHGNIKIHTIDQLVSHLDQIGASKTLINAFKEWKDNHSVAFNSSTSIKAYMNGYKLPDWNPTLQKAVESQKKYDADFNKGMMSFANDAMKKNSFVGANFYVNEQLEGMSSMAAIAGQADAAYQKTLADMHTHMIKFFEDNAGSKEVADMNRDMGLFTSLGMHHLSTDLKASNSYQSFMKSLEPLDVAVGNMKAFDNTVKEVLIAAGLEHTMTDAQVSKLTNKYKADIVKIAKGKDPFDKNRNTIQLAKSMLEEMNTRTRRDGDSLSNNNSLVDSFSTKLDMFVAANRVRNPKGFTDQKRFNRLIEEYFYKDQKTKDFTDANLKTWLDTELESKIQGSYSNQFNINPQLNYKRNGYTLSTKGKEKAGSVKINGQEVPLYFVKNDEINILNQDQVLVSTDITPFEKGQTKVRTKMKYDSSTKQNYIDIDGNKIYIDGKGDKGKSSLDLHVKPERMLKSSIKGEYGTAADFGFISMMTRNRGVSENLRIKKRARLEQIDMGLKSGVFITHEKYMSPNTNRTNYHKLGDPRTDSGSKIRVKNKSDDIRSKYGDLYYEKRFIADIEGSKGIKLHKKIDETFGKGAGSVIKTFVKTAIGARDFAKNTILVYSPGGWINSALSSMSIYMANASGASMVKDFREAGQIMKEFNKLSQAHSKNLAVAKDIPGGLTRKEQIEASRTALEASEGYTAMSYGLSSSMRSDAHINATYAQNPIVTMLNDFTGNRNVGQVMETIQADPNSRWGTKIGDAYDKLEVLPKFALYVNKKNAYGDARKGAQYAVMANPQYGRNLSPVANMVNEINPYMKYFTSWPTMAIYAAKQNPARLASVYTAYQASLWASWSVGREPMNAQEQSMYDDGYIRLPGDLGKFAKSAFNYSNPWASVAGHNAVDGMFPIEAFGHVAQPINYNFLRSINPTESKQE